MAAQWSNWARTARANPTRVETPTSLEQLADAVGRAAAAGERVRPTGGGLATNAIAAAPEVRIDTRGLRGLRSIDRAVGTATFGAGTTVAEASAILESDGLALLNPTSNTGVTLAGSASTGSHASGLRLPSASGQLVDVTLVDGSGEIVHVGERRNAELWTSVRLGLGALGVFGEVTVRTAPLHRVASSDSPMSLTRVLHDFDRLARSADHVAMRWMPHTGSVVVRTTRRLDGQGIDDPEPGRVGLGIARLREGVRTGFAKAFPRLIPALNTVSTIGQGRRDAVTGPISAITVRPPIPYASMQYAFDLDRVPAMVRGLRDLIRERGFRIPLPVLLTVAPAEDACLSTSYGRDTGSIALAMPSGMDPRPYFHAAEALFLEGGGLPHWGTYHTVRAAEFAHVMPRFGDFVGVRDRLDPDRRFGNAYLRRVLGD